MSAGWEPSEDVARAIDVARELKEELVKMGGVGEDLVPTLLVRRDRDFTVIALPPDRDGQLFAFEKAIEILAPDAAILVFEGYGLLDVRAGDESMPHGELARRFAAGDPLVLEGVIVSGHWPDGRTEAVCFPYRYAGRSIEWLDLINGSDKATGTFPSLAAAAFERAGEPPPIKVGLGRLAVALRAVGLDAFGPALPNRNEPCLCGSGQKFKYCCGRH